MTYKFERTSEPIDIDDMIRRYIEDRERQMALLDLFAYCCPDPVDTEPEDEP